HHTMASRNLLDLSLEMQLKTFELMRLCEECGVDLLVYCTVRPLEEQAILYRQSRPFAQIERKAVELSSGGYGFLAEILMGVGPQEGPHVTNAAPGESWHHYGEALDAVPLVSGKPAWNYAAHRKLWNAFGECAGEAGLCWAGHWSRF